MSKNLGLSGHSRADGRLPACRSGAMARHPQRHTRRQPTSSEIRGRPDKSHLVLIIAQPPRMARKQGRADQDARRLPNAMTTAAVLRLAVRRVRAPKAPPDGRLRSGRNAIEEIRGGRLSKRQGAWPCRAMLRRERARAPTPLWGANCRWDAATGRHGRSLIAWRCRPHRPGPRKSVFLFRSAIRNVRPPCRKIAERGSWEATDTALSCMILESSAAAELNRWDHRPNSWLCRRDHHPGAAL